MLGSQAQPHVRCTSCWCEPVLRHTSATGICVYIHRAWLLDGEQDQPPERLVNAVIAVSEAILPGPHRVSRDIHLALHGAVPVGKGGRRDRQ